MSTPSHTPEGRYRIEWNAKISKWQIKIPGFNVAIGEFYDNSTSSREEITKMFEACAGISNPATAIAKAVEALKDALKYGTNLPPDIQKDIKIALAGLRSSTREESK